MNIDDGHYKASLSHDVDCDHGECTGYFISELGLMVFVYKDDPTRISFHTEEKA